jgi:hypothetical protein
VSVVPVTQGHRYAAGLKVPFLAALAGSPLAQIKNQAQETGVTHITDPEAQKFLADQGWSEVTAYPAGRAPMVEPLSDHEIVILATRAATSGAIDTDATQWGGALRWVEETNVLPGTQPRPAQAGEKIPWMPIAVALGLLGGGAIMVAAFADPPRRNPARRRR